jgi:hypothetical protein
MLKFSARFGIWYNIEDGLGQIDARRDPNRTWVRAEQRPAPLVLIEQPADGEIDHLGLVAARELRRRLLDQRDNVGPVDGDDLGHIIILIMIALM